MIKGCEIVKRFAYVLLMATCLSACSSIDDDLSDCGPEVSQFQLSYQLKLVTNMTTELQTQLTTITEIDVANALQTHLQNIFTDYAHDVDLSFYEINGNYSRLNHDTHIMDANQKSYTLTLPMRRYRHLAVANIADNKQVSLASDNFSVTSKLLETEGTKAVPQNYLLSHNTGLFTARESMEVLEGVDQTFNVRLYMANCAASLVIDPKGNGYKKIQVFTTGFANSFFINDSIYTYPDNSPLVYAEEIATGNSLKCFTSVNFPSRDADAVSSGTPLWQFEIYVTKNDDTITKTVIDIYDPLKAGELKIIKGDIDTDGAIRPYNSSLGVSVTLDWNDGGTYAPIL